MVYEVSNNYTSRTIKNFGRYWTSVVEGISKADVWIKIYYRVERDSESVEWNSVGLLPNI